MSRKRLGCSLMRRVPFQDPILRSRHIYTSQRLGQYLHIRKSSGTPDVLQSRSSPKLAPHAKNSQHGIYGTRELDYELSEIHSKADAILRSTTVPSESATQEVMKACELLAEALWGQMNTERTASTPNSNLLGLEERKRRLQNDYPLSTVMREQIIGTISRTAYEIVTTPQVFVSSDILTSYVNVQSLLGRPETIPPVFLLYASKPIPQPSTTPIRYKSSNSKKLSSAIPLSIANHALKSAIQQRRLPVCFDIINTSVCTAAFRRAKIFKRAVIPFSGLGLTPVAAYSAASQWAAWQDTMDSPVARNIMFAGLLAYVSFTATLGVVAITTANDQMDRVTWASGTPLRERWLREEERAMVDRVAGAWGFQESWRRGEEEGPEWAKLREWTGLRRMVLDKVELMEGME